MPAVQGELKAPELFSRGCHIIRFNIVVKTLSNKYLSCADPWIFYLMSREHKVCATFRAFVCVLQ